MLTIVSCSFLYELSLVCYQSKYLALFSLAVLWGKFFLDCKCMCIKDLYRIILTLGNSFFLIKSYEGVIWYDFFQLVTLTYLYHG